MLLFVAQTALVAQRRVDVHRRLGVVGAVWALVLTAVGTATAIAFAFLLLPIAAIFLRVPVGHLLAQLGDRVTRDALIVSLKTSAIAHGSVLLVGTPVAYLLARRRFPGRGIVLTLVELPLVLPPAVAGIGLLAAFGRFGLLGDELDALGIRIGFTQAAVVLAVAFVESPFYLRGAVAAFESVDPNVLAAARTLGAGPWRVFLRVALPLAAAGLGAASALALARGLGEFGATIIFAGSLQGVTQTLPLAIYAQFAQNFDVALAISALFIAVGAAILIALKLVPATKTILRGSRGLAAT
jgi:molybdate transport system permease protein